MRVLWRFRYGLNAVSILMPVAMILNWQRTQK